MLIYPFWFVFGLYSQLHPCFDFGNRDFTSMMRLQSSEIK